MWKTQNADMIDLRLSSEQAGAELRQAQCKIIWLGLNKTNVSKFYKTDQVD